MSPENCTPETKSALSAALDEVEDLTERNRELLDLLLRIDRHRAECDRIENAINAVLRSAGNSR
jgi:hypothetical protein